MFYSGVVFLLSLLLEWLFSWSLWLLSKWLTRTFPSDGILSAIVNVVSGTQERAQHKTGTCLTVPRVTSKQQRAVTKMIPRIASQWCFPCSQEYYHSSSWFFKKSKTTPMILCSPSFLGGERISISMANVGSHWEKESVSCAGLNPPLQPGILKGKAGGRWRRNPPKHIWQFSECLQLAPLCFLGPVFFRTVQETARQLESGVGQLAYRIVQAHCGRGCLLDSMPENTAPLVGGNSNNV